MSTVAPPPTTAPPPATPPPAPTAVAITPPPALRALAIGARLDALVFNIGPKGLVEVTTDLGKITLRTSFALPKDAPIQLQVQSIGARVQFLITSVGGQPAAVGTRSAGNPAAALAGGPLTTGGATPKAGPANATPGLAGPTSPIVQLTLGSTLTATFLHAAKTPGLTGALTAQAPGGAAASLPSQARVTGPARAATAAGVPSTATAAARTAGSGGRAPNSSSGQPAATGTSQATAAGSTLTLKITGLQLPQPGAPQPPLPALLGGSPSVGQTLPGVVIGATAGGQTVVHTAAGPIALATSAALPIGTQVGLEVLSPPSLGDTSVADAVARRLGQMILETRSWPSLEDGAQALREASPATAQQFLNVLPRADATLTANILFFIAAMRGGDLRGWLGDAPVRTLERNRPNVLQRLREDFGSLSRLADDGGGNDWRSTPVPFVNGQQIEQIRMSVRREGDESDDDSRPGDTGIRFLIDLDLSRVGRFQMDGLVEEKTKHFNLVVRTDKKLPKAFEIGIRTIFMQVNEATGVKGGLIFQAAPANFIEPAPQNPAAADLGLTV